MSNKTKAPRARSGGQPLKDRARFSLSQDFRNPAVLEEDDLLPEDVKSLDSLNASRVMRKRGRGTREPTVTLKSQAAIAPAVSPLAEAVSGLAAAAAAGSPAAAPAAEESAENFVIPDTAALSPGSGREPSFEVPSSAEFERLSRTESAAPAAADAGAQPADGAGGAQTGNAEASAPAPESGSGPEERAAEDPDRVPVVPTLSDDEVPNEPGAILRHARELLGLSIREVAQKLKVRVNTVSDIEHERLNQPTAVAFARVHIANYARLVNIDVRTLVDLYERGVAAGAAEKERQVSRRRRSRRLAAGLKAAAVLILIAAAAYWAFRWLYRDAVPDTAGELSVGPDAPALYLEADVPQAGDAPEAEPAAAAASIFELPAPDSNTELAREQARALSAERGAPAAEEAGEEPSRATLMISNGTIVELDNGQELLPKKEDTAAPGAPRAPAAEAAPSEGASASGATRAPAAEAAPSESAPAAAPARGVIVTPEAPAAAPAPARESGSRAPAAPAPALSSQLKDISGAVAITGRQGLASMNNVTVTVGGDVALSVSDHKGKVLRSGVFKAGDRLTITGVPPLRVSLSDTSRVTLGYMGGRVTMPHDRQVSFILPTR